MRAVDTNVLVRLLTGDGGSQVAAAEAFVVGGAWISHIVLVEALWVLKSVYGVEPGRLLAALELLLDHESLTLQDPEVVAAAIARFRLHPKLGFSDCLVLETARKAGHTPLGTFDRALGGLSDASLL
jgi:predicted nucleic-acid-binding protein